MAFEIEHKYLVISNKYRDMAQRSERISQGYLSRNPAHTVRVRIIGNQGRITVKGITRGDTRLEFEYPVPEDDARAMLQLCDGPVIEKTRYYVPYAGHVWEVDEFIGHNAGLVVAEIELSASSHDYKLPEFIGEEVTGNPAYYNSNL